MCVIAKFLGCNMKVQIYVLYFNTCTVHLLVFCTMTNRRTIISQIITLLHFSTLSSHPQGVCNQYLVKLHQYFNTCTVHLLVFCTMTNRRTIISQIITLLHVSTLSSHPQGVCNQYLVKLHQYFNTCTVHLLVFCTMTNKCTQLFHKLSHCYMFRHYRVILRQPVINTLPSVFQVQLLVIQFTIRMFHRGRYRANTTVASTYRLYIQPLQQTVYTATTTDCIYSHHTDCIYSHHTDWLHENCSATSWF